MTHNRKSPYVKFAKVYCDRMGLFRVNEIKKNREYDELDILEGILILQDHQNKNRNGK